MIFFFQAEDGIRDYKVTGVQTCALPILGRSGPPDLILTGGRIFTADSERPWAEALALRGDRIVAVGSTDSVRRLAGPRTRALELGGRTVIPGLNDAHAHPGPELRGTRIAAATGDPALLEVVRALAAASRVRPRGTWLLATVGERVLDDPRTNRFFLDSVVPDHPVVLESWSGHMAILNSATLGTLGIGHDTPDPPGGRYGRAPGSGVLDGRLTEYAWWNARRRLSSSVPDSASRADLRRYADAAARFGITTVQDMNSALTTARAVALLRTADVAIRWRVIRFPMTRPGGRDVADARAARPSPGGMLRVSGRQSSLDGTPVGPPPRSRGGPEPRTLHDPRPDPAPLRARPGGRSAAAALAPHRRSPDRPRLRWSDEPVPQPHVRGDAPRQPCGGAHPRAGSSRLHARLGIRRVRRAGEGYAHARHAGRPRRLVAGHFCGSAGGALEDRERADVGGGEGGVRRGRGEISRQGNDGRLRSSPDTNRFRCSHTTATSSSTTSRAWSDSDCSVG